MPIDEIVKRAGGPRPPADLIRYIAGIDDYDEIVRSGAEVFTMFDLATQRLAGKPIRDFHRILDFGCGIGRVLQFFPDGPELFGCDVNKPVTEFAKHAFPRAEIRRNNLMPPMEYAERTFDLIYSYSVFSHLSLTVENSWLEELRRIGAKGCFYLVTVHGDWMIEATLGGEQTKAEQEGFYYKTGNHRPGTDLDFPEYYESSYHTSQYILTHWSKRFDVLAIIKGEDPCRYLWGDVRFEPIGNIPLFRPMGQDLVVMRKP